MATFGFHLAVFPIFLLIASISASAPVATSSSSWAPTAACTGSVAECKIGEEFNMDSESNRRILGTSMFLTYHVLQYNNVLCSHRGASYQNCQQGAEANLYHRGCTPLEHCHRK